MMRTENQYYLQQYGISPQPASQPQGPIYDPTTLDYESMVGGEFDFGGDEVAYATTSNSQSDLATLEGGGQVAGAANQDQLLQDLDGIVGDAEAAPQADPLILLQEIKEELKKPLSKTVLSEEQQEEFEDKISDLSAQARKKNVNLEELVVSIEGLKEAVGAAVEEATATHQEKVESARASVDSLLEKVEKSKLSSEQKQAFKDRLESLKEDLGETDVDVIEAGEKLDEINKEFGREAQIAELERKLETLPSKIPSEGWHKEETLKLANLVVEAMRSNEWGQVKSFLKDQRDHHKNHGNNFVPQFVGTIFMDLADSNEDKLDQFLALIPADVRGLMAEAATQEDVNSTEHLDDPLKYQYYGRPSATAERLRSSRIDESLEQIDGEPLE